MEKEKNLFERLNEIVSEAAESGCREDGDVALVLARCDDHQQLTFIKGTAGDVISMMANSMEMSVDIFKTAGCAVCAYVAKHKESRAVADFLDVLENAKSYEPKNENDDERETDCQD